MLNKKLFILNEKLAYTIFCFDKILIEWEITEVLLTA